jgi:glycosyltransferase involved in cell wall biosynthesis
VKASRVLVLFGELSLTGAPRLTLDILESIQPEASVRIASMKGGPLIDAARSLGPTVVLRHPFLEWAFPRRLARDHAVFYEMLAGVSARIRALQEAAKLRRWKPELVYVSSVAALPLVRMLRLGDAPVVLHVHELGSALASYQRDFPELILSVPGRYVAVSDAVAHDLSSHLGVPSDAISVVPPYVLTPIQEGVLPSPGADRPTLIVGGAGNPSWTKGIDLWLLAAREAVDRLGADRLRFVWVGYRDNEAGRQFRAMISKLKLDSVVELVPETDRAFDHFARFDMFAMSSWEESASLVVLEAMAMGVPVICFAPTGGPAEEVGGAGIVIEEMSPRRMADAIVDLAQSPQKRREMGAACAERVRERYQRSTSLAALTQVFDAAFSLRDRARRNGG